MGLESVELVLHVEEEFNIQIPDETAEQTRTVQQLHDCILQLSKSQNDTDLDSSETMNRLTDIVAMQLGVKRAVVTPDARFVEDLRIDRGICPRFGI